MGDLQGERAKLFEKSFRPLPLHPLTHFKNFWKKEGHSLTHFKNFKKEGYPLAYFKNFQEKVSVFTPFQKEKRRIA